MAVVGSGNNPVSSALSTNGMSVSDALKYLYDLFIGPQAAQQVNTASAVPPSVVPTADAYGALQPERVQPIAAERVQPLQPQRVQGVEPAATPTAPAQPAPAQPAAADPTSPIIRALMGLKGPDTASRGGAYPAPPNLWRGPNQGQTANAAPSPVSAAGNGQSNRGGGFDLQSLFDGGYSAKVNQTVQWLQSPQGGGLDAGTSMALANNPQLLQKYLGERMSGGYDFVTGRDGSIFRTDKRAGSIEQVYGGKPDQPTDVQEYEYAKGQGYQGTFQEFQIEQKRAGASQVNIDQKAEGAFDKKLAEKQAETFDAMSTEGMNAKADVALIGELDTLLAGQGGTFTGLAGHLAKYGIGGEGMDDLQAAQALINKLVPTQRQPGSGSMSDRDVELFTRSLPSLWNTPEGNKIILNTMKGLAQYKQAQGEIADMVLTGELSRQEARRMLRELPNPLAEFKQGAAGAGTSEGAPAKKRLRFNPATGALE